MESNGWSHWLVGALRREIPASASLEHVSRFTPLDEAWRSLATALDRPQTEVADLLARRFRLERADFDAIDPAAAALLPDSRAVKLGVVPVAHSDRWFTVATAHPLDADAEQEIAFLTGRTTRFQVATPDEIRAWWSRSTPSAESILDDVVARLVDEEGLDDLRVVESGSEVEITERELEKTPVVRLTNLIVQKAVEAHATDIHIEPERDGGRVRFRVDGVLQPFMNLPLPALIRVVSRIKILAQLDIADRMRPQDGRMRIEVQGRTFDLRISTVPLTGAEKVVIRVLDPEATFSLDGLGIPEDRRVELDELMSNRHGIVLVTGPTGSGKTTTLYGALARLSSNELNISTVEHPVEYELRGISQIQVDPKKGVTFASALRALLRQDPDVILVGEIRDPETAEIAAQAGMTGHMVLSTLHTTDAVGAVARLSELGLDPSVIASTLRGVVGQRLVRTFCPSCVRDTRSKWELDPAEQALVDRTGVLPARWAPGCPDCRDTGFRGRTPVLELLPIDREFARAIARDADESELRDLLAARGHRALVDGGLDRVRDGATSLLEIDRVIGFPESVRASAEEAAPAPGELTAAVVEAMAAPPASFGASDATVIDLVGRKRDRSPDDPGILVVDDDAGTRLIITTTLRKSGWRVVEAEDGVEALERLREDRGIRLVTLDLNMPRMGGMEVLRHLRADPVLSHVPVIVATHSDDEASELRLLQAGADDYVVKPISPTRLQSRVDAVLRRHELEPRVRHA